MDESENPEDISNVVHSPKDMAYELVEELEDGDRRRAQILAGRIQEMLLEEEARGMDVSNALEEAMEKFVEQSPSATEEMVEALDEPDRGVPATPPEWTEGGLHLDSVPARLQREILAMEGLYRITVEPEDRQGHHWRIRFENLEALFESSSHGV